MALFGHKHGVEPFAIEHASIATGDANGRSLEDMTIVVGENGTINEVAPSSQIGIPQDYHRIDATGKVVAPGLINAHVHLFSDGKPLDPKQTTPQSQARLGKLLHSPAGKSVLKLRVKANVDTLLKSGVTTIRSVGDVGYEVTQLRDSINSGKAVGPRIFASGPLLAIPGGHGAPLIALESETVEDAQNNAERNIDHGVNALKIAATGGVTDSQQPGEAGSPQMSVEQMRVICEVAHASNIIVAAHAQSPEGVKNALLAGVDTIEHGSALDDELIGLFKDNPNALHGYSSLIPTMSAGMPLTFFPQDVTGITDIQFDNAKSVVEGMLAGARDARLNGIRVGVGTDTAMTFVTQYNTWRELYLLTHYAGFSSAEAFHAATQVNAEILGISEETGSIEAGKSADLIVLDEDPTRNLKTLSNPRLVVVAGHPVWRPSVERIEDIDTLLDERL
jgi:imidazolonepropionase-like amidohydrolase